MQARVRAEEAEGDPAFIDPGRWVAFEAADVAGPGGEGGKTDGEAAADAFSKRRGGRFAVAAPALGE